MTTPIQILHRRDTAAHWTTANPVLGASEMGYETDTKKFKYGDGVTAWSSLTYFEAGSGDVVGPATATDNAVARFDQGTGDLIQNSLMTVDDAGSPNIPSGQSYKKNGTALAAADVGAAATSHTHGGGDITSGSLDGDRLPAPTTTKKGGVPATGTPAGKFLKDSGSWDTVTAGDTGLTVDVLYYVNCDTGNDGGAGTVGAPFRTVAHALTLIPKSLNGYDASIYLQASVNYAEEDLVLAGYHGGTIGIYGGGAAVWTGIEVITATNCDRLVISGITFHADDESWLISLNTTVAELILCYFSKAAGVTYSNALDINAESQVFVNSCGDRGGGHANVDYAYYVSNGSVVLYRGDKWGTNWRDGWMKDGALIEASYDLVQGADTSTDNAIARYDGINCNRVQDSLVTIDDSGSVNIPSGQSYKKNSVALAYGDVGAAASAHTHGGGDITSQVSDAHTVDGEHAAAFADASHAHGGGDITSGSLDGDRLAAPTTTKRGGVKETGTPSGKFLRDDDSWATAGGAYRRPATIVVAASDSADKTNVDFVCPATDALDYLTTTVIPSMPAAGGKILLMEGTYTVNTSSKPMVLNQGTVGIEIEGMGAGTVFKHGANSLNSKLIQISGNNSGVVMVRRITFDNTGVSATSSTGIDNSTTTPLQVQDCTFKALSWGILGWNADIFRCRFVSTSEYGVHAVRDTFTLINCSFDYSNAYLIEGNSGNHRIQSCDFYAIAKLYIARGVVIGSKFTNRGVEQLTGGSVGLRVLGCEITIVSGGAGDAQCVLLDGIGGIVEGNTLTVYDDADKPCVKIAAGGAGNMVLGNIMRPFVSTWTTPLGVRILAGATDNVVKGNLISTATKIEDAGTRTTYGDTELVELVNVLAEDVDAIVDNEDLNVSLPLTCTLDGQPDFGRNVTLTLTDVDDSISAINITVTGITSLGLVKVETFTFASFTAKVATGSYPFEKITEIKVNSATGIGTGDVLEVGIGKKLGLTGRLLAAGDIIWVKQNAAKTTAYTASATYGTIAPTTLTAADDFDIFWIRNANIWTV